MNLQEAISSGKSFRRTPVYPDYYTQQEREMRYEDTRFWYNVDQYGYIYYESYHKRYYGISKKEDIFANDWEIKQ